MRTIEELQDVASEIVGLFGEKRLSLTEISFIVGELDDYFTTLKVERFLENKKQHESINRFVDELSKSRVNEAVGDV